MYCLDTNIIIDILRGDTELKTKIDRLDVATTTITLCELFKGAYLSRDSEKNIKTIEDFIREIDILNLDEKSSRIVGKDYKNLKIQGKLIQDLDLIIASIAKRHNFVLATRNKKDFQNIPDLKIEEW